MIILGFWGGFGLGPLILIGIVGKGLELRFIQLCRRGLNLTGAAVEPTLLGGAVGVSTSPAAAAAATLAPLAIHATGIAFRRAFDHRLRRLDGSFHDRDIGFELLHFRILIARFKRDCRGFGP